LSTVTGNPLDDFKLFYEEILDNKPANGRIRRLRQSKANI